VVVATWACSPRLGQEGARIRHSQRIARRSQVRRRHAGLLAYPANVCPIQCGRAAGHSRPPGNILPNEKRGWQEIPASTGHETSWAGPDKGSSPSSGKTIRTKRKMSAYPSGITASSNGEPHRRIGRFKSAIRRQ
jgi:hypothetical protein